MPRIASNRMNRPPQRSEHAGMNPMSLIVVLCSKLRRPAPIRRRMRAAPWWRTPCTANKYKGPIARLKVGARLETSLERVASGAAVTSPCAARFLCASSNSAIGWVTPRPRVLLRANELYLRAKGNSGGFFCHLGGWLGESAPRQTRVTVFRGSWEGCCPAARVFRFNFVCAVSLISLKLPAVGYQARPLFR